MSSGPSPLTPDATTSRRRMVIPTPTVAMFELPALGPELARWFRHRDGFLQRYDGKRLLAPIAGGEGIASFKQAAEWASGDELSTVLIWALFDRERRTLAHSAAAFPARHDAEQNAREMQEWGSELKLVMPTYEGRIGWFAVYEDRPSVVASGWYPDKTAAARAARRAMVALAAATVLIEPLRRTAP